MISCSCFWSAEEHTNKRSLSIPFAGIFQVGSIIAAITLGEGDIVLLMLPIWISGAGIVASFLGFFAVGCKDGAGQKELMWALHKGVLVSSFLVVGFSALIVAFLFEGRETEGWELFGCICIGLVAGVLSTCFLHS